MRLVVLFLLACGLLSAADLSGTWLAQVETSAGSGTPTFTLKQDGDKITGHYSGTLGEADVTGTVDGENISWTFPISAQGIEGKATYKGKLIAAEKGGPYKIKGTVDLAGEVEGTFEASKK